MGVRRHLQTTSLEGAHASRDPAMSPPDHLGYEHLRLRQPRAQDPDELRCRLRPHLGPRVRQVVLHGRVRSGTARAYPGSQQAWGPGSLRTVWIGPARRHAPNRDRGGPRFLAGRLGHAVGRGAVDAVRREVLALRVSVSPPGALRGRIARRARRGGPMPPDPGTPRRLPRALAVSWRPGPPRQVANGDGLLVRGAFCRRGSRRSDRVSGCLAHRRLAGGG